MSKCVFLQLFDFISERATRRGRQKSQQSGPAYYAILFNELKEQPVHIPESSAHSNNPTSMHQRIGEFLSSRSGGSSASNHSNPHSSANNGKSSRTTSRSSFSHNLSSTLSNIKSSLLPKSWSVGDFTPRRSNSFDEGKPVSHI